MRRGLASVVVSLFLGAAAWCVPQASAQQAANPEADAFAGLFQQYQQAADPEERIALGERLLTLEPALTTWPLDVARDQVKAELWFGLGSAYVARSRGVRADNLEKGIARLETVLAVWTREADAQSWARAHNNIGIAYWGRIRGELADNQEKAIAHFEAALGVFSREAAPQEWAQLQNNLAVVHINRTHGTRAANVEAAIAHFDAALTVFIRETHPQLWAQIQNNLGTAYGRRVEGDPAGNRETAVEHLEAALTVLTRDASPLEWASAQNNLAYAYLNRNRGEQADNQEQAIAHLGAAFTVLTREAFPRQWATAQSLAGDAYADRVRGERAGNRQHAVAAYEAALSVFTREAFPQDHMRTAQRLGRVYLEAGEWRRAGTAQASAREAFLLLFGQGLEEDEARAIIAGAGPLFAEMAFAAVQRGETEAAFELADEGRARLMAVALKLQTLELPAAKRQRVDDLRVAIRSAQQAMDVTQGLDRAAAIEKLITLRQELLGLITSSSEGNNKPRTALSKARGITAAGGAVVLPIVTKVGGKILVSSKATRGEDLTVIDVPELTTDRLARLLIGRGDGSLTGWVGAYFINHLDGPERDKRWPEWLAAIDGLGPELWGLIGARLDAHLKMRGVKPGTRLFWLPSGWLGTLPLGLAQNPGSKRRLLDEYEIVYAPSIAALDAASSHSAPANPATLAVIINPTGDLPGTETEGAIVAGHFPGQARTLLEREAATPDAVLAALKGRTHWHFASHGTFSWTDPRQSALVMNGNTRLTVGRLLETDGLGRPRLVVLSACETGLSEITNSPDEFIGLPGAFTALGAAGVLGTLWPVSDAATALLIAKFYELHIDARLSPPTALRRAQAWLREATNSDLAAYAKVAAVRRRLESRQLARIEEALSTTELARSRNAAIVEWVGGDTKPNAGGAATRNAKRLARPYAHPYFWAGFIHTGL